jgi:hypothetical protein
MSDLSMRRWTTEIWAACALCFIALTLLAQRPHTTVADAPASGPMVVKGRLSGPEGRRTPSGASAVGWRSWVHVKVVGEAGMWFPDHDVCIQQNLDNLAVSDGRATLVIAPELFGPMLVRPPWVDRSLGPDRALQAPDVVPLGDVAAAATPTRLTREQRSWACPKFESAGGISYYHEQPLRRGIEVFVSGCRVGEELLPCGDHSDAVSTRPAKIGIDVTAWGGLGRTVVWIILALFGLGLYARARGWQWTAAKAGFAPSSGPYRTQVEPVGDASGPGESAPTPEPVSKLVAPKAGLSVLLSGPAVGLWILGIDGFLKRSWTLALASSVFIGIAVAAVHLWRWWRAPLAEDRRRLLAAAIAALVAGVASYFITLALGVLVAMFMFPLGAYPR